MATTTAVAPDLEPLLLVTNITLLSVKNYFHVLLNIHEIKKYFKHMFRSKRDPHFVTYEVFLQPARSFSEI